MIKKILFPFVFIALSAQMALAQSSELGLMLGYASYKGDLNRSMFNVKFFNPAAGIFFRRCINSHWSMRFGVNYGRISASDARSNDAFQQFRNLTFRSTVLEANGLFEFNFFQFQTAAERSSRATPFVFGGIAVYKFNPRAPLGDDWVALQPLGTEGQGTSQFSSRDKYARVQVSLPFGGGFKFKLNNRFSLTVETGARRTFTDYLDDVSTTYASKPILAATYGAESVLLSDRSPLAVTPDDYNNLRQRGNAADKDWYMFGGVTINWTLSKKYTDHCKPFRGHLR